MFFFYLSLPTAPRQRTAFENTVCPFSLCSFSIDVVRMGFFVLVQNVVGMTFCRDSFPARLRIVLYSQMIGSHEKTSFALFRHKRGLPDSYFFAFLRDKYLLYGANFTILCYNLLTNIG